MTELARLAQRILSPFFTSCIASSEPKKPVAPVTKII